MVPFIKQFLLWEWSQYFGSLSASIQYVKDQLKEYQKLLYWKIDLEYKCPHHKMFWNSNASNMEWMKLNMGKHSLKILHWMNYIWLSDWIEICGRCESWKVSRCFMHVRAGRLKKNTGETGLKQQKVSSKTKIKLSPIIYKLSFACINYWDSIWPTI